MHRQLVEKMSEGMDVTQIASLCARFLLSVAQLADTLRFSETALKFNSYFVVSSISECLTRSPAKTERRQHPFSSVLLRLHPNPLGRSQPILARRTNAVVHMAVYSFYSKSPLRLARPDPHRLPRLSQIVIKGMSRLYSFTRQHTCLCE